MTAQETIEQIQTSLGVSADGNFGPRSKAALAQLMNAAPWSEWPAAQGIYQATASTFADPDDIRRFRACKATGKSDQACFAVGDNGIGKWGANTAQTDTPMCAIHAADATAVFGSLDLAKHQFLEISVEDKTVIAKIEDQCGVQGRIDCNPATYLALGMKAGSLKPCTYRRVVPPTS